MAFLDSERLIRRGKIFRSPLESIIEPKKGRSASRPWRVVNDPSGDFLGRSFRNLDLAAKHKSYWAVGTIFEHKETGERKRWTRKGFVKLKMGQK